MCLSVCVFVSVCVFLCVCVHVRACPEIVFNWFISVEKDLQDVLRCKINEKLVYVCARARACVNLHACIFACMCECLLVLRYCLQGVWDMEE